jgi:hypothetical protein
MPGEGPDLAMHHRFSIDIPDDLWKPFKTRAIAEYGSPRQATLALLLAYINQPDSHSQGEPHASDDLQPRK